MILCKTRSFARSVILLGWLFLVNSFLYSFAPKYSNQSYSCRCFPCIDGVLIRGGGAQQAKLHTKICELRSYVRALDAHVVFMESVFTEDNSTVLEWFSGVAAQLKQTLTDTIKTFRQTHQKKLSPKLSKELQALEKLLHSNDNKNTSQRHIIQRINEIKNQIAIPGLTNFIELYTWVQDAKKQILELGKMRGILREEAFSWSVGAYNSKVFCHAWEQFIKTGSFEPVKACWSAVVDFAQGRDNGGFEKLFKDDIAAMVNTYDEEKNIAIAFLCVKDMAVMVQLLHAYFIADCKKYCVTDLRFDMQTIMNLIEIYNAVNALPIEQTINDISDLIKGFLELVTDLDQNAEDHFVGWLKSKWVYMPLTVGVMIIKIVQCFSAQSAA